MKQQLFNADNNGIFGTGISNETSESSPRALTGQTKTINNDLSETDEHNRMKVTHTNK